MKITIENGQLRINIHDLLSHLKPDEKRNLVDSLACEDDIIKAVADQIIDGWTEMGSYGYKHTGDIEPQTPLDKAVRAVAAGADYVAAREIRNLTDTMRRQHAYHKQTEQWAWKMHEMMRDANYAHTKCPLPPPLPSACDVSYDAYKVVKVEEREG